MDTKDKNDDEIVTKNDVQNQKKYNENQKHLVNLQYKW